MLISDLKEAPDCSAVSQLPPTNPDGGSSVDSLSADTLILVSQPQRDGDYKTATKYLSKSARMDELELHMGKALEIEKIKSNLEGKVNKSDLSTYATLCADTDIPYIISSFYISAGVVTRVDGYALSDGLATAIDRNGYVPNRLSTRIEYDSVRNYIVLRNFDGTISSYVDRDEVFEDLIKSDLSNVTVSKDGANVYMHFVISKPGCDPELKRIKVSLSNLSPYEFADGLKLVYPESDTQGKVSVAIDYAQISSTISVGNLVARIQALEDRLSGHSFVTYEQPIYK